MKIKKSNRVIVVLSLSFFLLSGLLLIAVAAQKGPAGTAQYVDIKPNKKYKMAFANWNDMNSFAIIARDSFTAAAKYYGVEMMLLDNKQDPVQANTNVDVAITAKVDAYFQYNQDEAVNRRIAQKLKGANIKGIAIQVPMGDNDPDLPFYLVNNYGTGTVCGELLANTAKTKWGANTPMSLFIANHPEAGEYFIQRGKGTVDSAKKILPQLEVSQISTKGSPEVTRQMTADFLTAHPKGKILMWCHIDQNTMGMLSAVKAASRLEDCLIVSVGAQPTMLPEIRNPKSIVLGTVAHFPEQWGWDVVPQVIRWLNDGVRPKSPQSPPYVMLTRENVDQYYPQTK